MPNNQGPIIDSGQRQKDEKRKEQKLVSEAKSAFSSGKSPAEFVKSRLSTMSEGHSNDAIRQAVMAKRDTPLSATPEPRKK